MWLEKLTMEKICGEICGLFFKPQKYLRDRGFFRGLIVFEPPQNYILLFMTYQNTDLVHFCGQKSWIIRSLFAVALRKPLFVLARIGIDFVGTLFYIFFHISPTPLRKALQTNEHTSLII